MSTAATHRGEIGQRPAEPALLGEYADHPRAAVGVGRGEVGGIRDGRQVALRGAAPLHLRDDADARRAQRRHHVPVGIAPAARRLISVKSTAASRAARSNPDALDDGIEDAASAYFPRGAPPLLYRGVSESDTLDSPAVTAARQDRPA